MNNYDTYDTKSNIKSKIKNYISYVYLRDIQQDIVRGMTFDSYRNYNLEEFIHYLEIQSYNLSSLRNIIRINDPDYLPLMYVSEYETEYTLYENRLSSRIWNTDDGKYYILTGVSVAIIDIKLSETRTINTPLYVAVSEDYNGTTIKSHIYYVTYQRNPMMPNYTSYMFFKPKN